MNYLAHTGQGSTSSTEHHVLAQDMPYIFDDTDFFEGPSGQAQAFNTNEMYIDDESDCQRLTNNSNRASYETVSDNSGAYLDASFGLAITRAPPSSLDMFKSSVGSSYLASSGSTTSENSSKSMTSAGVSWDEPSDRISRQDMDEMTTSETQAHQRPSSHDANQFSFPSDMSHEASLAQTHQFSRSFLHHQHQGILTTPLPSSTSPVFSSDATESPEDIAFRRAEQNRAAQRAFRQRKQKYIKWLESKAEELDEVYRIMALVRTENQQLCNLVMELDARLNSLDPTKSNMSPTNATIPSGSAPLQASSLSNTCKSISTLTALEPPFGRASDRSTPMDVRTRPDDSLGREISMRLMNLATFPILEASECEVTILGKLKHQPQPIGCGKGGPKGKTAFKPSQEFKQQHQKQEQQKKHQHKQQQEQQQQQQPHLSSRIQTPSTSSPKRTESPLSHSTPQQDQLPLGAPINNMKAQIQSNQGWSPSPRSSMSATPPSVSGAPEGEDAHMPLAFLPPSVDMSAATPSILQDTIMPSTKTPFQPQHQLLQNRSILFYGTPQQDIQSTTTTTTTQGIIATTSAPEQYANSVPTGVASLNIPNHGYLRLGQGTLIHHHPYANAQPPPLAHVISQQQPQHQLQHQQLDLTSLLVYPNEVALQPGQLSWTEEGLSWTEEELSNLRGRRSSMPTLQMDFQHQQLLPSHLGYPSLSAINPIPYS